MSKIKVLVCYHKKAALFKDEILTPIHVGRSNAKCRLDHNSENYKWLMENLIGDDTGDNISAKNDSYNEMTSLYWAWKNYDKLGNPDYVGLMHYRRHFVLKEGEKIVYNIQNLDMDTYYDTINYSPEKMEEFVGDCDFVAHLGKVQNVYRHFIENQRKTDIDLANQIVLEKYPEYEEIMKEYYSGDISNFCNMFIMKKELFFEYCEWIFSILEEFERRVDISEKRFFISERLSGLFIAKLMADNKLKYKTLPISFIDEPVEVQVAFDSSEKNELNNAIAITSIMENAKGYHAFHFYLMGNNHSEKSMNKWKLFEQKYDKCKIDFVSCDVPEGFLPLYLSDYLPKVNKCIYINGRVLSMFDIGEFYHVSSCDDYYMLGLPKGKYTPEKEEKTITDDILVINCKRMRKHNISGLVTDKMLTANDGVQAINDICKGQEGYFPWYYFTCEHIEGYDTSIFDRERSRGRIQAESLWRPFLIYDVESPIENNQGVFSVFWWNTFKALPTSFQKIQIRNVVLKNLYSSQQKEINDIRERKKRENAEWFHNSDGLNNTSENDYSEQNGALNDAEQNEEWRNYGLWGKLMFYQKHNGTRQTIKYVAKKYFCGGNE